MDLITPSRISSKTVWQDLRPNESSASQYSLTHGETKTWTKLLEAKESLTCSDMLPVLDDTEVEAGEFSGYEGLQHTDDPASIKLTVGVCNLGTKRRQQGHKCARFISWMDYTLNTPWCCTRAAGAACTGRCSASVWDPQPAVVGRSPAGFRAGISECSSAGRQTTAMRGGAAGEMNVASR